MAAVNYLQGLKLKPNDGSQAATRLRILFPDASVELLDLLRQLLQFDPSKRFSALEALEHPYMHMYRSAPRDDELPPPQVAPRGGRAGEVSRGKERGREGGAAGRVAAEGWEAAGRAGRRRR